MKLSDLEAKYKQKAYNIFDGVLNIQKNLDVTRIDELRKTSKSILQNNNIFENKKNEFLYQLIEDNLHNLEENINMYNQDNLENILQGKIYDALDNISYKLESLEQNEEYSYEEYEYNLNDDLDENLIKNALLNYLNKYKSSIVENLEKNRYSQNTIDSVVEQIEESMYNDYADILIEKIIQDHRRISFFQFLFPCRITFYQSRSKINDFQCSFTIKQQIVRADITMYDSSAMKPDQCLHHRLQNLHRFFCRNVMTLFQIIAQTAAF